jgi:hypothetical protein
VSETAPLTLTPSADANSSVAARSLPLTAMPSGTATRRLFDDAARRRVARARQVA